MVQGFVLPHGIEFWIILIVALLLFGHRIPGMARSLGSGIVEFKKGLRGDDAEKLPPPSSRSESAPPAAEKPRHEVQS
jgi:sec-independent protein translocase protein TatA